MADINDDFEEIANNNAELNTAAMIKTALDSSMLYFRSAIEAGYTEAQAMQIVLGLLLGK